MPQTVRSTRTPSLPLLQTVCSIFSPARGGAPYRARSFKLHLDRCRHGGRSDSNPDPKPPLNFLGPVGGRVGWGVLGGRLGAPSVGVPGIPTCVPFVALIILNTHLWGFLKKSLPPGGPVPAAGFGGGWAGVGGSGGENSFPVLHAHLNSL